LFEDVAILENLFHICVAKTISLDKGLIVHDGSGQARYSFLLPILLEPSFNLGKNGLHFRSSLARVILVSVHITPVSFRTR